MLRVSALLAFWLCALPVCAADARLAEDCRTRRAALRKALPNGIVLVFASTEKDSDDDRAGFFQEPSFAYLTGWDEPGALLAMTPTSEILFLPKRNAETEKWTGRKAAPGDAGIRERTGFDQVMALESFESQWPKLLEAAGTVYTPLRSPAAAKVRALAPLREVLDAAPEIAKLRMKKSALELERMRRSIDVTVEAHRAAWQRLAPGMHEYELAAVMTNVFMQRGCRRNAFAPIVGSGPNGAVLHYTGNSRQMDAGEVVVMDVGAECAGYAADVTRTVPVNGKFTGRQAELYDIVLGAHDAVLAGVKPGMTLAKTSPNSLYKIALDYCNAYGKDRSGAPLGKYFTHGIGHHVGLEVHDAGDPAAPLEAGMVITVEPGLYLPDEGIGIRIEDMVLVTATGGEVLTGALPNVRRKIEDALRR
jgi:Xaa-Pro aminopeptidase